MAATPSSLTPALPSGVLQAHCIRLKPGDDLVKTLSKAAQSAMEASSSQSAFLLSAVGSLSSVTMRLAMSSRRDAAGNAIEINDTRRWNEHFEIVSLVGTFAHKAAQKHLHISVANAAGETFGGHLIAGTVFTTLELVIGTIDNVRFSREMDEDTGYTELVVGPIKGQKRTREAGS